MATTFTNQATLRYNSTVTNSNIVTGTILDVLSATKTAVMDDYVAGDDITYVISIVNTGASAFTGLTVTDNLGAYAFGAGTLVPLTYVVGSLMYYINGVLQPTPAVTVDSSLIVSGITVPAGGNAMLIYEVNANQYAPLSASSTITNTATISGTGITAITAKETINTQDQATLSISKSICPPTVVENETLTYTFVIENYGNTAAIATDNVQVTDTFNPPLSGITVMLNGVAMAPSTDYTYNSATGVFSTVAGKITVPAATFTQSPTLGTWTVTPGVSVLTVKGTV